MALPGLFPIYPDPLPLKYQVSLAIPMPPDVTSEISKSLGITSSYPLLIPNVDMLQAFIKGDIGISDKLTKESLFLNFNNPIAQKDPKVLKSFAKNANFDLPDVEKYKKDGKIKIPKEDVVVPTADGIGLKGFEKTLLTSIFETQKPYLEIAKLVIGNVAKIEDIIARVMPLLGIPLTTKSLKPIGNNGVPGGRPKAMGYKNGEELKAALSKLQALTKKGTNVKIDKNGNVTREKNPFDKSGVTASVSGPGSNNTGSGSSDNWKIISTVYSTGAFDPKIDYQYIYIDLPPENKEPEEKVDLNLEDDDPYNKYKPEKVILGIFRADGTPLNPSEKLQTIGLNSDNTISYINTIFNRADWILRSPKWQMNNIYPNNQVTLAEPVKNVWPSLGSPIFTWERYLGAEKQNSKTQPSSSSPAPSWSLKKYKKGEKNILNKEDAIENSPVISGFDGLEVSSYSSYFTDLVKFKMDQSDLDQEDKNQYTKEIIGKINVQAHLENVFLYGQAKSSVYKEINAKPAFPDLMKMSFKPFRFYSSDAKSDDKITNYNKTQNIPAGYIWIDPEADYETKIIRVDPTTKISFEEAKGEPEIKSSIKSFIKNKARFSISTGDKFNFEISKNNLPAESFTDIDEYVLENWNYNSSLGLAPESRIENNNTYNISVWSKIPVRQYKDINGSLIIKKEPTGVNISDSTGSSNLPSNLLIYELINNGGIYYYKKYKWLVDIKKVKIIELLGKNRDNLLHDMYDKFEKDPNDTQEFTFKVGDIINYNNLGVISVGGLFSGNPLQGLPFLSVDKITNRSTSKLKTLLEYDSEGFSKKINLKFTLPSIGTFSLKNYDWTYSIKDMIAKINDTFPIVELDPFSMTFDIDMINYGFRSVIIKKLIDYDFSYSFTLKDFFPNKFYIPIEDGLQFLNDDPISKTRIYLENNKIIKWYYIYDRLLLKDDAQSDGLPTFGKDKKIIINYESDPMEFNSLPGATYRTIEGDLDIESTSTTIPLYQIKAENSNFPYGKVIDPSKITNEFLAKEDLFSKGKYGHGGVENPQEIEVIKRYMLTDLDTESYYIIEGILTDKNKQTDTVKTNSGSVDGGGYYKLPHAIGAIKVFISMLVDVFAKLIPAIVKLLKLFKNPASFVTDIIAEKMGEGFSIFSKDSIKSFESAKKVKEKVKDKKPSEKSREVTQVFKESPLKNHVFVDKKGDYKFLLDGIAMLPFELFGAKIPFGMEMNFDKIPDSSPIKLIMSDGLSKAKVKNLQAFLKPSLKDFKGPGADGKTGQLNLSDLKNLQDPIYKKFPNDLKINPNDSVITNIKYSTGTFINGIDYNYIYINDDTDRLLKEADELINTNADLIDPLKSAETLDKLKDALKKDQKNDAIKDRIKKLKLKGLDDNSQPLLKMLLGFVTLPIKIVAGIIEYIMDFFKSLTNPLTLVPKMIEFLSFSWIMKFFTPIGILNLAGVVFEPKKIAEWCALVHIPNPVPPAKPKIPDGYSLPADLLYKDAVPKGKYLIPDDYEIADFSQLISMPFMPKLPTYTARQLRENCGRPFKLFFPLICLFEKIVNGIIDLIWSSLGLEAIIPAPHLKLCSKSKDPGQADADALAKELGKEIFDPKDLKGLNGEDLNGNDIPKDSGFVYNITRDDGTVIKGLNYDEMQKYIKENEDIGYNFQF